MLDTSASKPSSAEKPPSGQVARARADARWLALPPGAPLVALVEALARVSTESELDAITASSPRARASALLTAETARALHALLRDDVTARASDEDFDGAAVGAGGAPSWDASARVARMRSWLTARAAADPTARRAAGLCEQVAEALPSADGPRRP